MGTRGFPPAAIVLLMLIVAAGCDRIGVAEPWQQTPTTVSTTAAGTAPPATTTTTGAIPTTAAVAGTTTTTAPPAIPPALAPGDVAEGIDGWLFNGSAFLATCSEDLPAAEQVVTNLDLFMKVLDAAGRKAAFFVVPDKRTVYADRLGPFADDALCAEAATSSLREALAEHPPHGYIDVWGLLVGAAAAGDEALYFRGDTHWAPRGSALASAAAVEALAPSLWQMDALVTSQTDERLGDLTKRLGSDQPERYFDARVLRPDVAVYHEGSAGGPPSVVSFRATSSSGTGLVPGTSVFLGDSFAGFMAQSQLAPYFENLLVVGWQTIVDQRGEWRYCCHVDIPPLPRNEAWLMGRLAAADAFLLETIELRVWERFATPRLAYRAMDALSESLPHEGLTPTDAPGDAGGIEITLPYPSLSRHPGRPFAVLTTTDPATFTALIGLQSSLAETPTFAERAASIPEVGLMVVPLSSIPPGADVVIRLFGVGPRNPVEARIVWIE